ncbi:hypothetical protein D9611_008900 [Ephemerocybe angulata]|uniref:GmrSD restriction endonucleases C-terminal domain-containing protein n=1 Tax=Ephemerocybe angulata TaxID=980116 RepID=A0A8H5BYT0_9AGAR|nr:hypothetical protein D9611_008900 [Tulosesus angulatus]
MADCSVLLLRLTVGYCANNQLVNLSNGGVPCRGNATYVYLETRRILSGMERVSLPFGTQLQLPIYTDRNVHSATDTRATVSQPPQADLTTAHYSVEYTLSVHYIWRPYPNSVIEVLRDHALLIIRYRYPLRPCALCAFLCHLDRPRYPRYRRHPIRVGYRCAIKSGCPSDIQAASIQVAFFPVSAPFLFNMKSISLSFVLLSVLGLALAAPVAEPEADAGLETGVFSRALPTPISAATARTYLSQLTVEAESNSPAYDRDLFVHWITTVLKRDGTNVVTDTSCAATSGNWVSPYDNVATTLASDLDIAWVSGARTWTNAQRQAFANDLTRPQLIAVTDNLNQAKDPAEWMPPLASYRCTYVRAWVQVKQYYNLTIDSAEKTALTTYLAAC